MPDRTDGLDAPAGWGGAAARPPAATAAEAKRSELDGSPWSEVTWFALQAGGVIGQRAWEEFGRERAFDSRHPLPARMSPRVGAVGCSCGRCSATARRNGGLDVGDAGALTRAPGRAHRPETVSTSATVVLMPLM